MTTIIGATQKIIVVSPSDRVVVSGYGPPGPQGPQGIQGPEGPEGPVAFGSVSHGAFTMPNLTTWYSPTWTPDGSSGLITAGSDGITVGADGWYLVGFRASLNLSGLPITNYVHIQVNKYGPSTGLLMEMFQLGVGQTNYGHVGGTRIVYLLAGNRVQMEAARTGSTPTFRQMNMWATRVIHPVDADPQSFPSNGAVVLGGEYIPELDGLTIGTGGSALNTAKYRYVGQPNVGGIGTMTITGRLVFGTTGVSYPTTWSYATMPPGFNYDGISGQQFTPVGWVRVTTSTVSALGPVIIHQTNIGRVRFLIGKADVTYLDGVGPSSTIPGTWAAGSYIEYTATFPAVRV